MFRRLAIIDAAQRVGFTLEEIRDLLGSRDQLAHERLRQLALLKLPELDDLIARATSVRRVLKICSKCSCESIDVCHMFDDRVLPLREYGSATPTRRARGDARAPGLTSTSVEVQQCRGGRRPSHAESQLVTYVIAEPCIGTKDNSCVEVCPVDCIHPTPDEPDYDAVEMLYIDPEECIDCDACVEACPVDAIFAEDQLPDEWQKYIQINVDYYKR